MDDSLVKADLSAESLVGQVTDEFLRRQEAGERPDVEVYATRYPQMAELLRKVLTSLQALDASLARRARASSEDAVTGTLGDFRIVGEVGRGAMGVVYEAEQISLGRRVALKVLPFAATMDPRQLGRFHNEARAVAGLQHPNVVQVFAVGCERAVHFYAMQFIPGRTLAQWIEARRATLQPRRPGDAETKTIAADATEPVPGNADHYRRAAEWGVQAAEALEYAHRAGVVHRDVKPANLLLDDHGKLFVTDFGLARLGADPGLTRTGEVVGTLRYMAPEQALAKHGLVDHRADVYALGATLYEVITLRPTVVGEDREEVLRGLAFEEPRSLRAVDRMAPAELETILTKAMAKCPEERYATAQEFANDLRRFLEDRPILARPPSLTTRVLKWARRHQLAVLTATAALAVLVVALAVGAWLLWQERGRTREALVHAGEQQRLAERHAEEALRASHVARVKLARQAWDAGDVLLARETLAKCRPQPGQKDLRGFVWRHLWYHSGLKPERPVVLSGHTGDTYAVAFASDGRHVATAGKDRTARLWDVATGRELRTFAEHDDEVNGVAFAPNGKTLATASDDRTVRLWDVATGKLLHKLPGHTHEVVGVVFTPDERSLISADRRSQVKVWDRSTARERVSFAHGHVDSLEGIALSPDGTTLATASKDCFTKLWDVASGRKITAHWSWNMLRAVAFSPDGRMLAGGTMTSPHEERAGLVIVWEAKTGALRATLRADGGHLEAVAYSPDGRCLVAAGTEGIVRVWDAESWKLVCAFRPRTHLKRVWGLSFRRDGLLAAATQDGTVTVWYPLPRGFRKLEASEGSPGDVVFSPDGKELATTNVGDAARRWDTTTGRRLPTQTHSSPARVTRSRAADGGKDTPLAVSPVGTAAVPVESDFGVAVVDARSGERRAVLRGHRSAVVRADFSPDGNTLATGCSSGEVKLWDVATGQEVLTLTRYYGTVHGLAFSPDGTMLATSGGVPHTSDTTLWYAPTLAEVDEAERWQ